jgi:hypothetical protein
MPTDKLENGPSGDRPAKQLMRWRTVNSQGDQICPRLNAKPAPILSGEPPRVVPLTLASPFGRQRKITGLRLFLSLNTEITLAAAGQIMAAEEFARL